MAERRKWKRYGPAYTVEWDNSSGQGKLTLVDVSKGGVGLLSAQCPKKDEKLGLRLFLKNKMFRCKVIPVYISKVRDGLFRIGSQFTGAPEDFAETFEKEIEEIARHKRESKLYHKKSLTFHSASEEYLKSHSSVS